MVHTQSPNVPKWSAAGLLALIFSVATLSPAQQQQYPIMDLGALGTAGGAASGINNQGQVSGFLTAAVAGCLVPTHAFRTTASRPINLATDELKPPGSPCSNSYAYRINDAGVVVGKWVEAKTQAYFAFIYSNGQMRNLPSLMPSGAMTEARGINNRGQVVGSSYKNTAPASWVAVLWDNGKIIDLGGWNSSAYGINNKGQVVGWTGAPARPFIWDPRTRTMQLLNNPFDTGDASKPHPAVSPQAGAYAINDNGLVVGWADEWVSPNYPYYARVAFMYDSATRKFTKIGPKGMASQAYGINNRGQVVGALSDGSRDYGFLYSGGQLHRIEGDLVPSGYGRHDGFGWTNVVANAINDAGQITGTGTHNGSTHAFLLTPKN